MEMQFFILGHVILLAICVSAGASLGGDSLDAFDWFLLSFFVLFIPLEIIYWVLHWFFV